MAEKELLDITVQYLDRDIPRDRNLRRDFLKEKFTAAAEELKTHNFDLRRVRLYKATCS